MVPGMSEIPGLKIFREKPKYLAVPGYCERASYPLCFSVCFDFVRRQANDIDITSSLACLDPR